MSLKEGGNILGCRECSSECHYRCCDQSLPGSEDFCRENAILLHPGEWEDSHDNAHILVSDTDHTGGRLGYCDKDNFDQSSCNDEKNFKPLDCKSYPFFPTIVDGQLKLALDVLRCPLSRNPDQLRAHYRTILALWVAAVEKDSRVVEWIQSFKLQGYILYDPQNE